MSNHLNRRQFIRLSGGAVVVAGLGACDRRADGGNAQTTTPSTAGSTSTTTPPASTPTTVATTSDGSTFDGRRLVVVQLNGGNALNCLLHPDGNRALIVQMS